MKKILFPLLFSTLVLSALLYFFGGSRHVKEKNIALAIQEANYCESKNDCAMAAVSACPFGCYILVNQSRVQEIQQLVNSYQSRCEYSCIEIKGFDCIANKCEIIK
jgi:hypothetical protein